MKKGDFVAYPSKADRMIHLGRVSSDYLYQPASEESYRHRRKVKWLRAVSRTQFSQGALHEIGAAMSIFLIKNYADEFLAAIEGEAPSVQPAKEPTVKQVAEEIEDTTRDFVLKTLSRETKGLPFEEFVKHLLERMGYQARLTRKNEPSVDIIAHKDLLEQASQGTALRRPGEGAGTAGARHSDQSGQPGSHHDLPQRLR